MIYHSHSLLLIFVDIITSGFFRFHQSWGSLLEEKWDLLPVKNERELETLIKQTSQAQRTQRFLMSTIRCHIKACRGRCAVEENYREVFKHNLSESAQDFF